MRERAKHGSGRWPARWRDRRFDAIEDFGWNSLGLNSDEGPYVHVEGEFQGREVFVQVLAQPPEGEEPGFNFDTTRKTLPPE